MRNHKALTQRVFMIMLLAIFGYASANAATYYAKAIAKVSSSGGGKVFVSTTNSSADAVWAESSEATKSGSSSWGRPSIGFYLFAQADEGYEFDHWATTDDNNTSASKNNPWNYSFQPASSATSEANATANTRYAVFKKKQNYYSALTANATEGGQVFVNTTNSSADAVYAATSSASQNTEATAAPSHNYYLYAQPADGYDFVGWATTTDGSTVSKNNPYNAKVTANSNDSEAPTEGTYYAIFAKAELHYSQTTATAQEGGNVFVSTTNSSAEAAWGTTSTASNNSFALEAPTHTYYYFAQAQDGYEFKGWMAEGSDAVISTENPYAGTVTANSTDEAAPAVKNLVAKFVTAVPHYSKVILKLNGNNDINNLGIKMLGGKVYVGRTAEEAESAQYEFTSELVQKTWSVDAASHDYYLYAKADEGFEYAGMGTTASATTSFNSTDNPYKVTVSATSTDEAAPTEKIYYVSFKYAADNKPSVCYANFTIVAMLAQDDGTGKLVNVESAEAGMFAVNYNDDASGKGANTADPVWHSGSSYASEAYSKPYTSGTVYFPFTIFAKANTGYEFIGWASTSTSTNPTQKGTLVDDYSYYYADSYTRTSVSNVNYPGSCGIEGGAKTKKYYAVFKKLEQMEEPTGETTVEVTEVKGTTSLVEGSVAKDFTVDLVLNEYVPYDKPGSEKNAKPNEILKQFVTVLGANGNKASVTNYSLVSESKDLGEDKDGISLGTAYTCHTLRLAFPYNVKADTYTVHLPYGLYTTVDGNKTPTYEFTITVTEDVNPFLTIKSQFPTEGLTMKYKAASQTSEPDASKGEFEKSNITAAITFNEVVESIDESKKDGIVLVNNTEGVNYKPTSVIRNAAILGKVSGEVSIAYPELVNGSYTLTIPAGLFAGNDKTNEEITVNFTVTGFKNTLKPYEMVTDQITPKANDMSQKIERLKDITISYKGEFGEAKALVGNASDIKVQRYTEVIQGDGEGAKPVRTYYNDVTSTPSAKVEDGKLVVSFTPSLTTGMYEVTVPAGLAANMEPGTMTMGQKVNAGYAETPAYTMTFKVETPVTKIDFAIKAENKYSTLILPFAAEIPEGLTVYTIDGIKDGTITVKSVDEIEAKTPYIVKAENGIETSFDGFMPDKVAASYDDNMNMIGVLAEEGVEPASGSYVLQNHDGKVGFYQIGEDWGKKVPQYRCYLHQQVSINAKALYFDFETTTIKAIDALTSGKAEIYDMNGRKLNKMQKGINIVNGVKVLVK